MKPVRFKKVTGRLSAGDLKYKKVKWRGLTWQDISRIVRDRDVECVKCGSVKDLQADHFHPQCYVWKKQFFNHHKIQTLCKICHNRLPSMKVRKKDWKTYCYRGEETRS